MFSRSRTWATALALGLLAVVFTTSYLGAFLDPSANTKDLPIALVNQDKGDLGHRLSVGITGENGDGAVRWTTTDSAEEARELLKDGTVYAAVEIPADFSARVQALNAAASANDGTGTATRPVLTVLTQPAVGPMAVGAAQGAATTAASGASRQLGASLLRPDATPVQKLLLQDPVRAEVREFRALPAQSAKGLAAFYVPLVLVVVSLMGATAVGAAVGRSPLTAASGARAGSPLRTKAALMLATSALITAGTLITAVAVLDLPAPHVTHLALLAFGISAAVGLLMLALTELLGLLAIPFGMIGFIVLGIPTSGGPYPMEMVPGTFRVLSHGLPLHHWVAGVRSLLYYDASGAAGATAAWTAVAGCLALAGVLISAARWRSRTGHAVDSAPTAL
ncbi:ABC transporter permease [Streptomyces sp. NPDC091272]|uniref:ABC transporter permease n=1 Tax=Streptomyces sp. NPDC091272 TaxID=3365981 RepID=UPI0037FB42EF